MGVIITAEKRSRINQCDRFAVGWIEVRKAQDYYGLERCFALNRFWSMDDRRSFLVFGMEAIVGRMPLKLDQSIIRFRTGNQNHWQHLERELPPHGSGRTKDPDAELRLSAAAAFHR